MELTMLPPMVAPAPKMAAFPSWKDVSSTRKKLITLVIYLFSNFFTTLLHLGGHLAAAIALTTNLKRHVAVAGGCRLRQSILDHADI
jgi:hypothetical protein